MLPIELPASLPNLTARLTNVQTDAFPDQNFHCHYLDDLGFLRLFWSLIILIILFFAMIMITVDIKIIVIILVFKITVMIAVIKIMAIIMMIVVIKIIAIIVHAWLSLFSRLSWLLWC